MPIVYERTIRLEKWWGLHWKGRPIRGLGQWQPLRPVFFTDTPITDTEVTLRKSAILTNLGLLPEQAERFPYRWSDTEGTWTTVSEERIAEALKAGWEFTADYTIGQDTYDVSWSIESPTGEFLGECGMGISEIIGSEQPFKVTAFEVWLFDKFDIRTVQVVLMTSYAYGNEGLRAKLAPKGRPVLAELDEDKIIVLETACLTLFAKVVEMEYGNIKNAPQSYFGKLTVRLTVSHKGAHHENLH